MVRPEPPNAVAANDVTRFWGLNWVGAGKVFAVGNIVRVTANAPPANFLHPHAYEDRVVVGGSTLQVIGNLNTEALVEAVKGGTSSTVREAYEDNLIRNQNGKSHIDPETQCPSLGAVNRKPRHIELFQHTYNNKTKLRARLSSGGVQYDLPITATKAQSYVRRNGLASLQELMNEHEDVHVRLGLARPFQGNPCWAQINGLLFH